MLFFKLVIECGHMGAGKAVEKMWFMKGANMVDIMLKARKLPQVKKKDSTVSIKLIKEISRQEYVNGIVTKKYGYAMAN